MLEIIAYLAITLLIGLVAAYFYVEAQKRKIQEAHRKAILSRISILKNRFKNNLKGLVEKEILTVREHDAIYRIANNFFVFQPAIINTVDYCEQLLENVINAIPMESVDNIHLDLIQKQVNIFARALPVATSDYKADFYRNTLPNLTQQLANSQEYIFPINDDIDELDSNETTVQAEDEINSEASLQSVPAA